MSLSVLVTHSHIHFFLMAEILDKHQTLMSRFSAQGL